MRPRAACRSGSPSPACLTAWLFFLKRPELADAAARRWSLLRSLLVNKYYFDWFNEKVVAAGALLLGGVFGTAATRR